MEFSRSPCDCMHSPKTITPISHYFGIDTFNEKVMREKLSDEYFKKLQECAENHKKLDIETANAVAQAMKEWALENGATHFAHWFQPLTDISAEKHDAFIEFESPGKVIERFSGEQLIQGEPDASSFPTGGLRTTFEARGYTAWDMSSPAFLRKNGRGITLCLPSAFISYHGDALDRKIPLLRSLEAVNKSGLRLLRLLGNTTAKKIICNIGAEQEYFCIDAEYIHKRPDLALIGRTLLGAAPSKGQELKDQYFGSIKERIQSFMHEAEEEFYKLGIPAKTRHNEVAPSQFEIAPIHEEANIAVDHNLLIMELLQRVARRHNMAVLLHEKPFSGINGSGKHLNWSLSTNDGCNLFSPGKSPGENIQFLLILLAVIRGVYKHSGLLRASVASASNDHRLGAHEAPPALISIFLGDQLNHILESIENGIFKEVTAETILNLGISSLPSLRKDNTDRNRTSPFAFTGNKFEFRAVGSSQNISLPATTLNAIMAESFDEIADILENHPAASTEEAVIDILKNELPKVKAVLFMGDNYSQDWQEEALRRGLPILKSTPEALDSFTSKSTQKLFTDYNILSSHELQSRYTIRLEQYIKEIEIEAKILFKMVAGEVIPAAIKYQENIASSIHKAEAVLGTSVDLSIQKNFLKKISELINKIHIGLSNLESALKNKTAREDLRELATYMSKDILERMAALRENVDTIELLIDDQLWVLPKFWKMLFVNEGKT